MAASLGSVGQQGRRDGAADAGCPDRGVAAPSRGTRATAGAWHRASTSALFGGQGARSAVATSNQGAVQVSKGQIRQLSP